MTTSGHGFKRSNYSDYGREIADSSMAQFVANCAAVHGRSELIAHTFYDTVAIEGDWASFFAVPQGAGKIVYETNMYLPCSLPQPQAFWVSGVSIEMMVGRENAFRPAVFALHMGSKPYWSGPAPLVVRPSLRACVDPGAVMLRLDPGLGIPSGMSFRAELRFPKKLRQFSRVRCELHGWLIRPYQ